MRSSESFREFVLEQLARVRGIRARAMFGGVGLYADEVFFGIIAADTLYFKVDDTNRRDFELAASHAFKPYDDKPMTMPYYNVPADVLEDRDTLTRWAARAVVSAVRSKTKKPAKSPMAAKGRKTTS
jgi:DNA transformation protein